MLGEIGLTATEVAGGAAATVSGSMIAGTVIERVDGSEAAAFGSIYGAMGGMAIAGMAAAAINQLVPSYIRQVRSSGETVSIDGIHDEIHRLTTKNLALQTELNGIYRKFAGL